MPLVINFHGFTQSGKNMQLTSRMDAASEKHGFVVAYPDGLSSAWNAGNCCTQFALPPPGDVDDLQFTRDLIDAISKDYCIDKKRIYATGLSNGALFSYRLACALADTIAAIAPVAGSIPIDPAQCSPKRPVPVIHFHGKADEFEPFGGGAPALAGIFGTLFIDFRSVPDSIGKFRTADGVAAQSKIVYQKGEVTCEEWGGGKDNSAVRLCTIEKGGHTWPGGAPDPDYSFLGEQTQDIDATETMLQFFADHPMP
jgi:polyhydroxybutyrate depolymerase